MSAVKTIPVSGIWLDARGESVRVRAEVNKEWVTVIETKIGEGHTSHIVEPSGIEAAVVAAHDKTMEQLYGAFECAPLPPCELSYAGRTHEHPRFPSGDCVICGALCTERCKHSLATETEAANA